MRKSKNINVRRTLLRLKVGKSVELPLERMNYIRSCCTILDIVEHKKYSTHIDRAEGVIVVTRIS